MFREKKRLIAIQNSGKSEENMTKDFNPDSNYQLNMKCVSINRPCARKRIKYISNPTYLEGDNNIYMKYIDDWVDIYLFDERNKILRKFFENIETNTINNIYLHRNTGFGKTHILIDLVARLRFRYLKENVNEKPETLIFYFMFHISEFKSHEFLQEFYFACFPLIRYEKAIQKFSNLNKDSINNNQLTKLENYFESIYRKVNIDDVMDIINQIIFHISSIHRVKLLVIFDQINEINKTNDPEFKSNRELLPKKLQKFYDTFDTHIVSKIFGSSDNNETMRSVVRKKYCDPFDLEE